LRAEEGVSFVKRLQDCKSAFGIRGRAAKLLELTVRPVHQQHLPIKFFASRRYDAVEFVNPSKLVELWVFIGIKLEALCVFAADERRVHLQHRRFSSAECDAGAFA